MSDSGSPTLVLRNLKSYVTKHEILIYEYEILILNYSSSPSTFFFSAWTLLFFFLKTIGASSSSTSLVSLLFSVVSIDVEVLVSLGNASWKEHYIYYQLWQLKAIVLSEFECTYLFICLFVWCFTILCNQFWIATDLGYHVSPFIHLQFMLLYVNFKKCRLAQQ